MWATFVFRKMCARSASACVCTCVRFIGVLHRWYTQYARTYFRTEIQYHQLLIKSDSDGNKTYWTRNAGMNSSDVLRVLLLLCIASARYRILNKYAIRVWLSCVVHFRLFFHVTIFKEFHAGSILCRRVRLLLFLISRLVRSTVTSSIHRFHVRFNAFKCLIKLCIDVINPSVTLIYKKKLVRDLLHFSLIFVSFRFDFNLFTYIKQIILYHRTET